MMMDFLHHGSRDPFLYVEYSGSYYQFVSTIEPDLGGKLTADQLTILKLFSTEVNNGKRVEESELLNILLSKGQVKIDEFATLIYGKHGFKTTLETINSVISNLNFYFINKRNSIKGLLGLDDLVNNENDIISISDYFKKQLLNPTFQNYLLDSVNYGVTRFDQTFDLNKYLDGFLIHHKYSRKDICRILNWANNEEATIFGYRIKYNTCPIFVNYQKDENIAASTKFEDKFINNSYFQWFSKPRRYINSDDVSAIKNHNNNLRLLLFVKKSNNEGNDFYYMGDVKPMDNSFKETTILNDHGVNVPVVKVIFKLNQPVEDSLYNYLTQ